MKPFVTVLLFVFIQSAAYTQGIAELDSARYFDFWAGSWTASWDEGDGVKPLGTNTISWILDGTVLQENFEVKEGMSKGFKGTSLTVFQTRFNRWKQAWADNQGGYFDLVGEFTGEKRILKTQVVERGDKKIQQRMVFYDITERSMTWDWEMSQDGGATWTLQWRIFYTK